MLKIKIIGLAVAGFLLFAALAGAAPPQDYMLGCIFKNPDGSVFRMSRYYLRDGDKFRTEYITTVQYDVSAGAEVSTDLSDDGNPESHVRDSAELRTEYLTGDIEPHTVEILRKDKRLVWLLDTSFKVYSQVPLKADGWENTNAALFVNDFSKLKKTGETRLLNYPCDIYQTEERGGWSNIVTVAQGMNVILRAELRQNGKLAQTMEATEFRLEKPAASLFEIPTGYKKN